MTGASGFIGDALCRTLVAAGYAVTGCAHQHPAKLPAGIHAVQVDLSSPTETDRLIRAVQPDVIFHLASCVKGARDRDLVLPTFSANLAATLHLLNAAADQGCRRLVLTGSLEEPQQVTEAPSSPYAASKQAATAYARMYHALYDFPTVIARVFMVYGPGQRDESKLVPYVIRSLLNGEAPDISSGVRPVDWIYVQDVVDGLIRMAASDALCGQTVELGSGTLHTVREVVERMAALIPGSPAPRFGSAGDRKMEQVRCADLMRMQEQLNWTPSTDLNEGLRATLDSIRNASDSGRSL